MRSLLITLLASITIISNAQTFISYKDTINNFSINVPSGWKYGINKAFPDIAFIAIRSPADASEPARDNYNINIINTPTKNLEKSFADFSKYLSGAPNFKLIDKGDTILNGIAFKWLIETHKNDNSDVQMHNYDFVALKDGKTYILTFVTFSDSFNAVRPLFDKIAASFKLM